MVLLEVSLPSGFVLNTDYFDSLKEKIPIIKRTETKNNDTVGIVFFEYLTSKPVCLNLVGLRRHIVTARKPSPIIIYDYYDSGKRTLENNAPITFNLLFLSNLSQRSVHASSIPSVEKLNGRRNQAKHQMWSTMIQLQTNPNYFTFKLNVISIIK